MMTTAKIARLSSTQVCVANLSYICLRCDKLLTQTLKSQSQN